MFLELNDNVSDLKDSIGVVLVTITPEIFRQVMLSVRRLLQLQSCRAVRTSTICVEWRIYALDKEGHQIAEAVPFLQKRRPFS